MAPQPQSKEHSQTTAASMNDEAYVNTCIPSTLTIITVVEEEACKKLVLQKMYITGTCPEAV